MELVYKDFVVYVGMYVRMLKLGAGNKYTNFTKGTDKKCYVRKHGRHIVSRPWISGYETEMKDTYEHTNTDMHDDCHTHISMDTVPGDKTNYQRSQFAWL